MNNYNSKDVEISIIMSIYNGEKWLAESIDSVINQSYKIFELLIIDDGSTDKTADILKSYELKDNRIRLVHNSQNLGLTQSLNIGLELSKGNYIARIDCDDLWHPEKLEKQINYLANNPQISILGTASKIIDEYGQVNKKYRIRFVEEDENIRRFIIRFNPFTHSSILFRKSVYQKLGGYDNKFLFAQDYEYWIRVLNKYKGANLPQILTFRRNSPGCITIKKEKKQRWFAVKAKLKAIKVLGRPFLEIVYIMPDLMVAFLPAIILNNLRRAKKMMVGLSKPSPLL